MSRAATATELVRARARTLKMPGLARSGEPLARQAREEGWSHEEYLYQDGRPSGERRQRAAATQGANSALDLASCLVDRTLDVGRAQAEVLDRIPIKPHAAVERDRAEAGLGGPRNPARRDDEDEREECEQSCL